MKNFALILVCFCLFGIGFCDSACTKDDIDTIITCYKDDNVNLSGPLGYIELVVSVMMRNEKKEIWEPICDKKKNLNDCIGNVRIKNCMNVKDLKGLPIPINFNFSFMPNLIPKVVVTSFIETDHICDKLLKFSDKDYKCYNKMIPIINATCHQPAINTTEISCKYLNQIARCITETTYKHCGKTVACFERKHDQLSFCFVPNNCEYCNNLGVANNPVDGLCDDDNHIGKAGKITVGNNRVGLNLRQLFEKQKIGENKQYSNFK